MIIGIDFSINSPAICVDSNFISFTRSAARKGKMRETWEYLKEFDCFFGHSLPEKPTEFKSTLRNTEIELMKTLDAKHSVEKIMREIEPYLKDSTFEAIGIEGLSFGSIRSIRQLELAGYQYILRDKILNFVKPSQFYIIPPTNVKKVAGKGNFKKTDMFTAFLKEDTKLFGLQNFLKKNGEPSKPLDDIIDAYYVRKATKMLVDESKS